MWEITSSLGARTMGAATSLRWGTRIRSPSSVSRWVVRSSRATTVPAISPARIRSPTLQSPELRSTTPAARSPMAGHAATTAAASSPATASRATSGSQASARYTPQIR